MRQCGGGVLDTWCTGPNNRDAFVVSSSIITKPIGQAATIFNFQVNPADDTYLGCTCVGVSGWTMTPTYVAGQAVNFGKNGGQPIELAWITLAVINSFTEDYRCSPTLYQTAPYSISHGSANAGSGTGGCTNHNPTSATFTVNYVFNCANATMTASDISDFTVEQTKTQYSVSQIWGSNQNCCCPADTPTYIVASFPSGMDATTSRSAFTLIYNPTTQNLFITAAPSLAIMRGDYILQLYQQISGQPQINKTSYTTVTVTQCAVTLTMSIPSQTHYIGLNSSTSWSLDPFSFTQSANVCNYTYSYNYTGVPYFVTPTLGVLNSTLNLSTTTTDWLLAYSNPSTTMTVTVTANENSAVTVTANVILLLIDPCQTIPITSTDIIDFIVRKTKTITGTTLLWYTGNNSLCPLSAPNFTVTSSPVGTNAANEPVFTISQNAPNLILSATPSATSIAGIYNVLITQCISGSPIRNLCTSQSVNVQVGACPDILTISPSQPLNKTHTIGFTPITNFLIDLNSFIEDNSACGYSFNYTNSALPLYLYFYYGTDSLTIETNTINQTLAVSNPTTFVTITIYAVSDPTITLSFDIIFIILDPCINTNLVNETIPNMYSTVLNSATTSFQMNLVNDTISLNLSSNTNGTNFCINRTYTITSSPMSNSTYAPNVLNNYLTTPQSLSNNITIDVNGNITLSASGWSLYGQHSVTVTVNFSPLIFTTFNFYVFIDACQVLNLDLTQQVTPEIYTIADPPLDMNFDNSYAIQTPLCGYNLSFNFSNTSNIINCTTSTYCYAKSLNRSEAGLKNLTQQVYVNYFNNQSFVNSTSFLINFIDPCPNTNITCSSQFVLNSINLTSWQGYNSSTSNIFSVSDSVSDRIKQANQTDDFCGKLSQKYYINDQNDLSGLLSWTNDTYVTYQPNLNTTAGQSNGALIVSLNEFANKTCTQNFNLTTISCTPPNIPSIPKYLVGSNQSFEFNFTNFIYDYFQAQNSNYSLYIYNGTKDLTSRQILDLKQQDFVIQYPNNLTHLDFLDLDQQSNKFIVFSNDYQNAYKQFNIVLVDTQDGKVCYTNFTLNTQWQIPYIRPNTPPQFDSDVKKLFFLPGCTNFDWQYKLPEQIDGEGDEILPMQIKISKANIIYDVTNKTFYLVQPVDKNSTVEIQIRLEDDKGSYQIIKILVQFACQSEPEKLQISKNLEQIQKQTKWPGCEIQSINLTGMITVKFNSTMNVPEKDYELQNGTTVVDETSYPNIVVNMIPGKYSDVSLLKFNWTYVNRSYTSSSFQIQVNFENPLSISTFDQPDYLEIIIYGYPYFLDVQGNFLRDGGFKLKKKVIPIQTTKKKAIQAIKNGVISSQSATTIIITSFIANLMAAGPLQQILGVVKSTNIFVHMLLINVNMPGSASLFFSKLMSLLTFQLVNMDNFYDDLFKFNDDEDQEAMNDQFQLFGYQSFYCLKNLGSVILFIVFPFVFWIITEVIAKTCIPKLKSFAKRQQENLFFDKSFTFIDESFLLLMMCATINLKMFKWNSFGTIANSATATLVFSTLCVFPFFICFLYQNDDVVGFIKKREKTFTQRFGSLVSDLNVFIEGKKAISYIWTQQLRKIMLVLTIVYLQDYILWSLYSFIYLSLFMGCVIGYTNPLKYQFQNKMELFNEFCILIVIYHLMCFTDLVPGPQERETVGKSLQYTIIFNVCINFLLIIINTTTHALRKLKIYWLKLKQKQNIKRAAEERQRKIEALADSRRIIREINEIADQIREKEELNEMLQQIGQVKNQKQKKLEKERQKKKDLLESKMKQKNNLKQGKTKPLNFNNATHKFVPSNLQNAQFFTDDIEAQNSVKQNNNSQILIKRKILADPDDPDDLHLKFSLVDPYYLHEPVNEDRSWREKEIANQKPITKRQIYCNHVAQYERQTNKTQIAKRWLNNKIATKINKNSGIKENKKINQSNGKKMQKLVQTYLQYNQFTKKN